MGAIDYVRTPHMSCPDCGSDVGWETKAREHPQCEDVTVAQLMPQAPEWDGRRRVVMVGDCVRCNYFIEVYVYGTIIVDGDVQAPDIPALEARVEHARAIAACSIGQPDRAENVAYREQCEAELREARHAIEAR